MSFLLLLCSKTFPQSYEISEFERYGILILILHHCVVLWNPLIQGIPDYHILWASLPKVTFINNPNTRPSQSMCIFKQPAQFTATDGLTAAYATSHMSSSSSCAITDWAAPRGRAVPSVDRKQREMGGAAPLTSHQFAVACVRQSVALGPIWQTLWKISDARGWLSQQNQYSGSIHYWYAVATDIDS